MKYQEVVFIQGEEGEKFCEQYSLGMLAENLLGALDYLKEWDYGDSPLYEGEGVPWGEADTVFRFGGYVLAYNPPLGYAGLSFEVES